MGHRLQHEVSHVPGGQTQATQQLPTSFPSARSCASSICGVKRWCSGTTSWYLLPSGTCPGTYEMLSC